MTSSSAINRLARLAEHCAAMKCGTRSKYTHGCRCELCRASNREYARRNHRLRYTGRGNPLVDAAPAIAHLAELAAQGVGYKSVAIASGVRQPTLSDLKAGRRTHISARNMTRILAVTADARGDCALVDAGPTWGRLRQLIADGYTHTQLAAWMGVGNRIQFAKDKVTAKTENRVKRLMILLEQGRLARA